MGQQPELFPGIAFGEDVSDIPPQTKAAFWTWYFGETGWLPAKGNDEQFKTFVGQVTGALEQDPNVDVDDPDTIQAIIVGILGEIDDTDRIQ